MKYFGIIFLLFTSVLVNAQNKYIESGDFNFEHHFYKEAIIDYKKAQEQKKLSPESKVYIKKQIAYSYYKLFDYEKAEKSFKELIDDENNNDYKAYINYGDVLRNNGEYMKAVDVYKKYAGITGNVGEVDFYKKACQWAIDNKNLKQNYNIDITNIETGGRSFGVAIYNGGLIYSKSESSEFDSKTTFYDICFARTKDNITFDQPEKLSGTMNKSFYEGAPSLTGDKRTLYYTANASEREKYKERKREKKKYQLSNEGVNILNICVAEKEGDVWSNSKVLPFNNLQYSCTHPSVSKDGNTLYFVSNMPGGYGGYDLYVSIKNDSSWSKPQNLGPEVNSSQNEMTPFIKGDTLYFSSKGKLGYGGSDVYYAILKNGAVHAVKNLGYPINSTKDDFGFVITDDQKSGYLSSNRKGNNGYDYIYYFEQFIPEYPDTIQAVTINKVTGKRISGVELTVVPMVDTISTDSLETNEIGEREIILPKHIEYVVNFNAEGFEPVAINIPAEEREDIVALFGKIEFTPVAKKDMVLEIEEIYFELDKADIRPESEPQLEKIIEYLEFYPDIKVELSAHTDSRASHEYNLKLSQRRAESTVKYLVDKGIERARLVPKGYGERKPRNKCKNGVPCSEEEHMFNRRVELKVLND